MQVKLKRACGIKKSAGVKLGQTGETYDLPAAEAARLIELGAADPVAEAIEEADIPVEESPPEEEPEAADEAAEEDDPETDYSSLTKAKLQALLDENGIAYASSFTKAELIALLET